MPMNAFFQQMHAARKAGKPSFSYKGNTYKRSKSKSGMVVYKKAGKGGKAKGGAVRSGGAVSSGGAVRSGGSMSAQGRAVNKYGKRATVLARKSTNTVVNRGPEAVAYAKQAKEALGGRIGRRRKRRT